MTSLAQGAAGLALVLAFALLCPRQVDAALRLLGAQAAVVTIALLAQDSLVPAVGVAAFGVGVIPMVLRRVMVRLDLPHETGISMGVHRTVAAGGGCALLALQFGKADLPLAVVLLSVLLVATRRHPVMQIAGLAALQNGIALLAAGQPIGPAALMVLPVIPALALLALWHQRREPA